LVSREGSELGSVDALTAKVEGLVAACVREGLTGDVIELTWRPAKGQKSS
jgi:hypothetical protein